MDGKLNGIIIDGKVYEIAERGCFHCAFGYNSLTDEKGYPVKEICSIFPCPNPEKDNCFRYSQELTNKLNDK